jgi:hypothetical protein
MLTTEAVTGAQTLCASVGKPISPRHEEAPVADSQAGEAPKADTPKPLPAKKEEKQESIITSCTTSTATSTATAISSQAPPAAVFTGAASKNAAGVLGAAAVAARVF